MIDNYAQLIEQAPDGVLIHDGERIVAVNAATLRLAGASRPDQLVGQPVSVLFERPYLKAVERSLCGDRAGIDALGFARERLHGVDGRVRDVDVWAMLFFEHDRPTAHLVLHDARAQIESERDQRAAFDTTRSAERVVEWHHVAGGLAHQLNNRLQVVLGLGGELTFAALSPGERDDLHSILRAASDCATIALRLLQLSGNAPHTPRRAFLDTVILEIVEDLNASAAADVGRVGISTGTVPLVQVDHGQCRLMLECLLENAREATRKRGQIQVEVSTRTLSQARLSSDGRVMEAGRYATVTVRDTGQGITLDVQRRMLEPFFTTRLVDNAMGLGLPAVQGMIRQNAGFLTFSSERGSGSTFTLWLPAVPDHLRREDDAKPLLGEQGRPTILVVERHDAARAGLVRSLERVGYSVLATRSSEEAVELLRLVALPLAIVVGSSTPPRVAHGDTPVWQWPGVPMLMLAPDHGLMSANAGAGTRMWAALEAPFSEYELVRAVHELIAAAPERNDARR